MTLTEELRFDTTPPQNPPGPPGPSGDPAVLNDRFVQIDLAQANADFDRAIAGLGNLPVSLAVKTLGRYQRVITSLEAEIIAGHQAAGASRGETEDLIDQGGKRSKKERKKRANRGTTLNNNPDLKDDVADGSVSEEQLDDLAAADAKTGGAASSDPGLLDEVRGSNPDQSKDAIKDFVDEHNKPDEESEHDRQRRLRGVARFTNNDGLDSIMANGDTATLNTVWDLIKARANVLYLKDGGRDVSPSKHPRSHTQRLFDAFVDLITNNAGGSGVRPTIVVGVTLDDDGRPVDPVQFGSGPLPQSVFDRYLCNSTVAGVLFSADGQPLWLGRKQRFGTPAQVTALIARDKGCVLCRAPHGECEAHHLMPWEAPGKGRTDIANLALVCRSCHHLLHDTKKTLFQDDAGRWKTRPATADEISPPRRPTKAPPPSPGRRTDE